MRRYTIYLLLILAGMIFLAEASRAQDSSLRGRVIWRSGAPVIGMEVRLEKDNQTLERTFTNQSGMYAFFGIDPSIGEFVVVIADRSRVLKEVRMYYPDDHIIPDITI